MKKSVKLFTVLFASITALAFVGCEKEPNFSEADYFNEINGTAWAWVINNTEYEKCTNEYQHYTESSTSTSDGWVDPNWVTSTSTRTEPVSTEDCSGIFIYFYNDGDNKVNIGTFKGTKTTDSYTYKVEVQTNTKTGKSAEFPDAKDKALQKSKAKVTYSITSCEAKDTSSVAIYGSKRVGFDSMGLRYYNTADANIFKLYKDTCLVQDMYTSSVLTKEKNNNILNLYYSKGEAKCSSYTDPAKTKCTGTMKYKSYSNWTRMDVLDNMKGNHSSGSSSY